MNASSRNKQQADGFEIDCFTILNLTKDVNKNTLLDYLVYKLNERMREECFLAIEAFHEHINVNLMTETNFNKRFENF